VPFYIQKQRASLEQFGSTADMLMGSVLDSNSTTATDGDQQQRTAVAEAQSTRSASSAASSTVAPSHGGGPTATTATSTTAAASAAAATSATGWSMKSVNRVQFKPASTLQLLWQTHSDLDIFAAKDLQDFALASDALQLADSNSRCACDIYIMYYCMCFLLYSLLYATGHCLQ
jgi:hypothetical protein